MKGLHEDIVKRYNRIQGSRKKKTTYSRVNCKKNYLDPNSTYHVYSLQQLQIIKTYIQHFNVCKKIPYEYKNAK